MSRERDEVIEVMDKYLAAMKAVGKTPESITLTAKQFNVLRLAAGPIGAGDNWKPRYKGIQVRKQ